MFIKWRKTFQWKASRSWYRFKLWWGWWYCECCEKMHSPVTAKYDFQDSEEYECCRGIDDIQVLKAFEDDPEYFKKLTLDLHRVG